MIATKPIEASGPRSGIALQLVFVLLAAGIVATGIFYYRSQVKYHRAAVESQLSAIADLKVDELVRWRRHRLSDATVFFKNPSFSALVQRYFEKPSEAATQRQLRDWIARFLGVEDYDGVLLLDAQGATRLSLPADMAPMSAVVSQRLSGILQSSQPSFQDFYRSEDNQSIHLAVLVPILDESGANRPLGALVLRINPEVHLYPFINRWPTFSSTAETLLVRREGNEVVFLNELRFQTNTALNLRSSLDRVILPAVQAALGRQGIVDGLDYRGVPVVAAVRSIPDSPWSLVARMDRTEVYGALRNQFWQVVAMIGILLFGAGAVIGLVGRQQRVRFYQERVAGSEALMASEVRYRRLFESAKDGILILNAETGTIVDVNPFLIELLGFSREHFLDKKVWELGSFKDIVANQDSFAELQAQKYIRYVDKPLETAAGRRIAVEFVSNVYLVNHQKVIQCNIRDTTERKRAEAELQFRNVLLATQQEASIDGILVVDENGRILSSNRRFAEMWGIPADVLESKADERALQSVMDKLADPEAFISKVRHLYAAREERSRDEVALNDGRTFDRYSAPMFGPDNRYYGRVWYFRDITERKQAEESLRLSEELFRSLSASSPVGIFLTDGNGRPTYFNPRWRAIHGLSLMQAMDEGWIQVIHPEDRERVLKHLADGVQTQQGVNEEWRILRPDGMTRWVRMCSAIRYADTGEHIGFVGTLEDITERKRAEEALRESERRFRTVLETMSLLGVMLDRTGQITLCNDYLLALTGRKRDEVLHRDWFELFLPPEIRVDVRQEAFLKSIATGQATAHFENEIITGTGERRLIMWDNTFIHDSTGSVTGVACIGVDITERKRGEVALRQSEQRFRALTENSSDVISILKADGTICYDSPSVTRILGYNPDERVGRNALASLHPDDRAEIEQVFLEELQHPGRVVTRDFRYRHKDGSWRFVNAIGVNLLADESVRGIVITTRDVTQRRQTERQLRLQSSALESAANAIVITDPTGNIVWVNPAFTTLTGYEASEVLGKNPRILKSGQHDEAFYRRLWETIGAGKVWSGELVNQRKDGSRYTEELTITPVRSERGEIANFIAIKLDISARKQMEDALQQSNRQLAEALADMKRSQSKMIAHERLRVIGQMASGIAHDFNNALAPILGFCELLLDRPEGLRNEQRLRQYLETMQAGAKDAAGVVRRMRELYRPRSAATELTVVNLSQLVQQAVSLTQPRWKDETQAAGAPVRVEMELAEVPVVPGNESALRELLTNLIFNAVDAMPAGGTLRLRTIRREEEIILEVADTGAGMSEEVRQHCFDAFFTTKGAQGSGLGLAMAKAIIDSHDGTIEVQSQVGQGTTFTIRLPIRGLPQPAIEPPHIKGPLRPGRILLVDDEPALREVFTEYLTESGHQIETAPDGRVGLEKFTAGTFDLVITDMAMPELNGEQLAARIHDRAPAIPVILLTGFGDLMKAQGEKPPGIAAVVGKPVSLNDLREAVQDALAANGGGA